MTNPVFKFKMCLAGDSGVGKSWFATINDKDYPIPTNESATSDLYENSTIGIDLRNAVREHAMVARQSGNMISCTAKHEVWDTAGQERFNSIVRSYFRNADIVILFYSLVDKTTYDNLETRWIPMATTEVSGHRCQFFIIGTFADKLKENGGEMERVVSRKDAENLASEYKAGYFEIDSKRKGGLSSYQTFSTISHLCCENAPDPIESQPTIIVVQNKTTTAKKKKKC